ncbi:response regulator [bacterium]|nr:response regulator [bacterium]
MTNKNSNAILLVEDNLDHAQIVLIILKKLQIDHILYHVTNGEDALDFLRHQGKYANTKKYPRPDVILLDLRLPKVDGIEVLHNIKKSTELKDIPVVIVTSSSADNDIEQATDFKVYSYVVKPYFDQFSKILYDLGFQTIPQ